jgi:hypothetical protein
MSPTPTPTPEPAPAVAPLAPSVTPETKSISTMYLLDVKVKSSAKELDVASYNIKNLKDGVNDQDAVSMKQLTGVSDKVEGVKTRVTTAESDITTIKARLDTGDVSDLKTRVTTAEGKITETTTRVTTAEDNITQLKTRVTTAEGTINHGTWGNVNLDSRMGKVEAVIEKVLNPDELATLDNLTDIIKAVPQDGIDLAGILAKGFDNDKENATKLTDEISRAKAAEGVLTKSLNTLSVMNVMLDATNPIFTADGAVVEAVPAGKGVLSGAYFKSQPQSTNNAPKSKLNFYVLDPSNTKFTDFEFMSSNIQLINPTGVPHMVVYSKNKSLAAQTNVWYNTKRMYVYQGSSSLKANNPYQFYAKIDKDADSKNLLKSALELVELTYIEPSFGANGVGNNSGYTDYKNPGVFDPANEEILYATLHTSSQLSSAAPGVFELIFSNIVTQYKNSISTNFLIDGAALTAKAEIERSTQKDVELQNRTLGTSKTLQSLIKFLLNLDVDLEQANGFSFVQQA